MNDHTRTLRLALYGALISLGALSGCSILKNPFAKEPSSAETALASVASGAPGPSAATRAAIVSGMDTSVPASTSPKAPPRANLDYIETDSFDKHLAAALASDLPVVRVRFVYEVQPSDLPEKLQFLLSSIQRTGGVVDMTVPLADQNPTPSWSIKGAMDRIYTKLERFFSNLSNSSKSMIERAWKKPFESIDTRNASVVFGQNKKGQVIITSVNFTQRDSTTTQVTPMAPSSRP